MAFISGNRALTESEMEHNAIEVWSYFKVWGWTLNAVAGMLGNMQAESTINPGRWENGVEYGGGYGLVQWTPYTNYSDWAGAGWQNNGTKQCERIIYEWNGNYQQWISTGSYPLSFKAFSASHPNTSPQLFFTTMRDPATPARQKATGKLGHGSGTTISAALHRLPPGLKVCRCG